MEESIDRFRTMCHETLAPIVLIFTKKDLFMKNLDGCAVPKDMPYISESTDHDTFMADTFHYFGTVFRSIARGWRTISVYWINAIDTTGFASIFLEIREDVLECRKIVKESPTAQDQRRLWGHGFSSVHWALQARGELLPPPHSLRALPSKVLAQIITHLIPTTHPTAHLSIPLSRPYTPYYALPPRSADLLSLALTSKHLHTLTKEPLRKEREREQGDLHGAREAVARLLMYGAGDRETAVGWLRAW